ncbi:MULTISPECIES: RidA family protein [unclassified Imperialibacter]|uniref:RidA family protein n=1 Tax=unclassified Imperialibacter TaxID=2629706 RepID=UPI001258738E|nr:MULTISPECIES: RidA family protein [unclassified Imperialibacter]CAD5251012.1 2-iminobutanoate/2-iminopropanoate deaminase [Imperialibacter sp. 89]CAD5283848.1 2-iminobutanoate/2-iminopropanoate deaminase [Imperialibacter sp. 75]VVT10688.1 2-iminobutanoate/2-iminopropanoate deaminase [Imperialibacter sp. EC-SDR9]
MKKIHSDEAPKAIGPYSQAIRSGGLIFCSGQTPIVPDTNKMVEGEIGPQTRQALMNLSAVLKAEGLSLADVVKTTVFLKNFRDFPAMNAVYAEVFGEHQPARSTVEVSRLPLDALVEIECVAEAG